MERDGIGKLHLAVMAIALWGLVGCTFDLSIHQASIGSHSPGPNLPISLSPGDFPIGKMDFYLKEAFFYQPTVGGNFVVRDSTDPGCNIRTVDSNFAPVGCFYAGEVLSMTLDSSGNVYVGNGTLNQVKKFDKDGNLLLTIGGTGTGNGLFNSPADITVAPGGEIYVIDRGNHRVQKFDAAGNFILAFGGLGTGNGQLTLPYGVEINQDGDVLVADSNNARIQKFSPLGVYISKFGSAAPMDGALQLPTNIAVDPATGDVYVADFFQQVILKYDSAGVFQWKTSSGALQFGSQVAFFGGEVVIPDTTHILYYSAAGAFLREKKPQGSTLQNPYALAMSAEHHFYVGNATEIQEYNYQGQLLRSFGTFLAVSGLAVDKVGNIYVSDMNASTVLKYSPAGILLGTFGSPGAGAGQLDRPMGLLVVDDVLYVCDTYNLRIQKFSTSGVYLGMFGDASGPGYIVGPSGIALGSDNRLYISAVAGPVFKYDLNGNYISTMGTFNVDDSVTDFEYAVGVYADQDGHVFVLDYDLNRITKFDTSGNYLATIGSYGGLPGLLHGPAGITGDPFGNIYVLETGNQRIQKFNYLGIAQDE